MATKLSKPVTRVTEINGDRWNVTLDYAGVSFRPYRGRTLVMLPYTMALTRAAWVAGEKDKPKRRKRVKRSKI